jgi:hypothetical protein
MFEDVAGSFGYGRGEKSYSTLSACKLLIINELRLAESGGFSNLALRRFS